MSILFSHVFIKVVIALLLGLMMYMQVMNFIRYRKNNGANYTRVAVFLSTLCSFIHTIHIMGIKEVHGGFWFGAVICFFTIYLKDQNSIE